ncbi:U4/U6.U5 tri-snRNP-associated protein 1, putative [Plasmodium knowlesi strain H]|uniref:U4/U6.U5 tri-snRNP-associated protein 1, putative n=3 Tax=Plasmodium knowlesi TaxID=5850 RepID=A0A5K1UKI6_PLAKH|nr:U4/U6.U5 tri-snRNP-associated protein 1, putative [Plasmodium knowlesi strain H]OTN66015.1 putative SART-1 family protein [Plasmodium knowlesi]CAA9987810.1 U4/U6.U5 tri-snRNP-associated protein 1, putative [Plasmodium knowlesi strain H]SBO22396.1 U4/U6.U5 tri-snRNP-associated protein 1, putative [Plasmodium knowlesi strain H]SBO29519.1 U4/U6.U5 tri-snRNP-associated protein 1, putative [Plasmodium knowlesi strain H]VVS77284.1 U4/U6.U5 tri-snRNP-associated protein 1, putative [Plasmodium know|eukprot:XP_002258807.1 SART-1 family protein, putative [Plasmodium knowlesi strain H]
MENEVELSIEETNKLREKLGLKKLDVEDKQEKKKNKRGLSKSEQDNETKGRAKRGGKKNGKKEEDEQEGEDKDGRSKTNEPPKGSNKSVKTISEEFNDDIDDVEKWINKTRNTIDRKLADDEGIKYSDDEEEKGKKKNKKKKNNVNRSVTSGHATVEHKNEELTDDMILTLKDQHVLNNDEEKDCLINEELKKKNVKSLLAKNDDSFWRKNYYDPLSYYDDTNKLNADDGSAVHMISKYDETKHTIDVTIKYDEDGDDHDDVTANSGRGRAKGKGGRTAKSKNNRQEDEEKGEGQMQHTQKALSMQKSTSPDGLFKMKKRKIKNINRRKKEEDAWAFLYDDPEGQDEEGDAHEEKQTKASATKRNTTEGKTRGNEQNNENANVIEDVLKKIRDEQANMDFNGYFDYDLGENEENKELYELLQQGNTLKRRKKEMDYQKELLKYIVINDDVKRNEETSGNVIKLSDASEFCRSITLPMEIQENENMAKLQKGGRGLLDVDASALLREDRLSNPLGSPSVNANDDMLRSSDGKKGKGKATKGDQANDGDSHEDDNNMNLNDDEFSQDGVSEIFNEIKLDEGLYGALEYLKTKGELNMEEKIYRNPENRPLHMSTSKHDIKLDYKNDSGKVMTPKETFRYISWIFHGKKQGKNKMEKKMRRMEIERRFKEDPMGSLPTLNVLKKVQQVQKKSYFTLSNNN